MNKPGEPEGLRAAVLGCLSGFTPGGTMQEISRTPREGPGYTVEDLQLKGARAIPATLVRPSGTGPFPAVLYAHGQNEDPGLGRHELLRGSPHLSAPYGPDLAAMGFASLAIDATGFGDRRQDGPPKTTALSLSWWGQSLFAFMLNDLSLALGYLSARPDVDARRVFSLGLSMGGALAFWLAALDRRIAGTAHLCILGDARPMIASGLHERLGAGLLVPGLLRIGDIGSVAGLVAPRPQLACFGGRDPLTPGDARTPALSRVQEAYQRANATDKFAFFIDPDAGHGESPAMRVRVMDFLDAGMRLPMPIED